MLLHLNPSSGVPVYLQLEAQVKQAVAAGALRTGDALPSTRKLAAELRINPNTVAHAYQNLLGIAITGTLGILMGLLVLASGRNLWAVIIGHGLFDASRFVLFYFQGPPTG